MCWWRNYKKNKWKHMDLTWFDKLPTFTEIRKKTFIISESWLYTRVFILNLRYWNFKNTPELYHEPPNLSFTLNNKNTNLDGKYRHFTPTFAPFFPYVFHSVWVTYYNNMLRSVILNWDWRKHNCAKIITL